MIKTGPTFGDFITRGKEKRGVWIKIERYGLRSFFPIFCLIICFFLIFAKLFYLQIVRGNYYKKLAEGNRTNTKTIKAERGIIFDRKGKPLVRNLPAFKIFQNNKTTWFEKNEALEMISKGKGEKLEMDVQREYLYGKAFSHLLGYIGEISEKELSLSYFSEYKASDFIGKSGIEKEYEYLLKGRDGKELFEVDARGAIIRSLGIHDPIAGKNIKTSLDLDLQLTAYKALKNVKKGTVIVSDPNNGAILAMVSVPSFDPNLFTHSNYDRENDSLLFSSAKNVDEALAQILFDNENEPFLNRSISGTYPPGSTFKLVTSVAALESGAINKDTKIEDTGVLRVGEFSFGNWYFSSSGKTEGFINVVDAIKRSNDIFFYKTAEATGVEKITEMARKFGLGDRLGIDLSGEEKGNIPSDAWKKETIGEPWYLGDTYHYGIGQGYLLVTPLQVNNWTAFFANGGKLVKPYIIDKTSLDKEAVKLMDIFNSNTVNLLQKDFVKKENIDLVREGMKLSCEPGGVGWPFFEFKVPTSAKASAGKQNSNIIIDGKNFIEEEASGGAKLTRITIGCKTGTAETYKDETPHAWFTAFAPYYNPEVVITVLVENGGEGSNVAAPIAKKILEEYFSKSN